MPRTPCPAPCSALAKESASHGSDPILTLEHLPCTLREFERTIRHLVKKRLHTLPLSKVCARLHAAGVALRREPEAVREVLARSAEVEDLVQDVACAMTLAVQRGRLVAARPVIYCWVARTVHQLVPNKSRVAALAALTGTPLAETLSKEDDADDGSAVALDRLRFECGESAEDQMVRCEAAGLKLAGLTPSQREVVVPFVRGEGVSEIAAELGVSRVAVSLRLMQARKRLEAA